MKTPTIPQATTQSSSYNLNLSSDYLPNWGGWEVAREIISNAIDADPHLKISYPSPDVLEVTTSTVPALSEMFIIGQGTKSANGETIGQFGEGSKMAALVATRCGSMELFLPNHHVTFSFKQQANMGVETLHAEVSEQTGINEFRVKITFPGISLISKGRILFNSPEGPLKIANKKASIIYCKGVYITEIASETSSSPPLFDWNLDKLTLNRDRSMVNYSTLQIAMRDWFENNMTVEIAEQILKKVSCFETAPVYMADRSQTVRASLLQAWKNVYGESLLASSDEATASAKRQNYNVVKINNINLRSSLIVSDVPLDSSVVNHKNTFIPATNQQTQVIAQLRKLDALIGAPTLNEIVVYQTVRENHFGSADFKNLTIYLSEDLFTPGNQFNLIRTYLHEMAHIMSNGANDATLEFESALDNLLGKLGTFTLTQIN